MTTKPVLEPVPPGVCHHCFRKPVARLAFGIAGMRRLLCEDRCAPAWDRFVSAVEKLHAYQVWKDDVEQDDAPSVVVVSREPARARAPEPPPPVHEPPKADAPAPQLGLFGGAA